MMSKKNKNSSSNLFLGLFLIFLGGIWLLRKLDISIYFPNINWSVIFEPIYNLFANFSDVIFSWPMLLLVIGLIMLANRRKMGPAFTIVGALFLIPIIFNLTSISLSLLLPTLLIAIGVSVIFQNRSISEKEKEIEDEVIDTKL